VVNGAVC